MNWAPHILAALVCVLAMVAGALNRPRLAWVAVLVVLAYQLTACTPDAPCIRSEKRLHMLPSGKVLVPVQMLVCVQFAASGAAP